MASLRAELAAMAAILTFLAFVRPCSGREYQLAECCKTCTFEKTKACGGTCISWSDNCHSPPGCACNSTTPPPPPPPAHSDPDYDHQTATYHAQFKPLEIEKAKLTITPFFSPDHSIEVLVDFINNAEKTLDIMTPGFSSWSKCTPSEGCQGCDVPDCNNESFPVFPALLNALNRGVTVRLITNKYSPTTCEGKITPLEFLFLNGLDVKFYTSTTFMHAKFLKRDGKVVSISSVNWSRNSIMNDREAGALIEGAKLCEKCHFTSAGDDADQVLQFVDSVFDFDWNNGLKMEISQTYNASDMAIITNKAIRNITIPPGPDRPYVTPTPTPIQIESDFKLWTSPDYAYDALMGDINRTKSDFQLYIYQITHPNLCDFVLNLHKSGIKLKILVSKLIYGIPDRDRAELCYSRLDNAGVTVQTGKVYSFAFYNHEKFWIVDGTSVSIATGNWSPSDYPGYNTSYPPFGQSGWQSINRDFTMTYTDSDVVSVYQTVLDKDYSDGAPWSPSSRLIVV